jgi:molybdopterin converting factor small subunit
MRMIDVRLYASLVPAKGGAPSSLSGPAGFQVKARPGLTVREVLAEVRVSSEDVCVVTLNNVRADLDAPLSEGDRVGLFPAISGG